MCAHQAGRFKHLNRSLLKMSVDMNSVPPLCNNIYFADYTVDAPSVRLVWPCAGKWNQQSRPVIEPKGNRSAVCPRWDETVYTRWDKHSEMWHLSLTELLFIARIWTVEVFWFHNVLPALETCERREDTGRIGIHSARMLQILVTVNVQMQI